MNAVGSLVLLFASVISLQYNAFILFIALVIGSILLSPEVWMYVIGAGFVTFILYISGIDNWDILSLMVIAIVYSLMSSKERKTSEYPPVPYIYGVR